MRMRQQISASVLALKHSPRYGPKNETMRQDERARDPDVRMGDAHLHGHHYPYFRVMQSQGDVHGNIPATTMEL